MPQHAPAHPYSSTKILDWIRKDRYLPRPFPRARHPTTPSPCEWTYICEWIRVMFSEWETRKRDRSRTLFQMCSRSSVWWVLSRISASNIYLIQGSTWIGCDNVSTSLTSMKIGGCGSPVGWVPPWMMVNTNLQKILILHLQSSGAKFNSSPFQFMHLWQFDKYCIVTHQHKIEIHITYQAALFH